MHEKIMDYIIQLNLLFRWTNSPLFIGRKQKQQHIDI